MFIYIIALILCVFYLFIQGTGKKSQRPFFLVIILLIFGVISGSRFELGGEDYIIYKYAYEATPKIAEFLINISNIHSNYETYGFEIGYLLITSVVKTLGFNYNAFLMLHSFFFFFALYYFIKRNAFSYLIVIAIFMYKMYFYNTFISLRQSITVAIFLLAIEYIKSRKPFHYFIMILIASFIHSGAIVLFPLYFINRINFNLKNIIILNILFWPTIIIRVLNIPVASYFIPLITWFPNDVIVNKISNYANNMGNSGLGYLHSIEYFILMLLVIIYYNKIKNASSNSNIFIGLFLCLLPLFTLFSGYDITTRFKDYFIITYGILLGYICLNTGKLGYIIKLLILFICIVGTLRYMIVFDNGSLLDYKSFFIK